MKDRTRIQHAYEITLPELKEKLGLVGDITMVDLCGDHVQINTSEKGK